MAGRGDAHGGSHLHLGFGVAARAVQLGAAVFTDLSQRLVGALAACVLAVGGHVLVAQGIAAQAQVLAAFAAALSLLFIQTLVDLIRGLVVLVVAAVCLAVKQLALEQVVALAFQVFCGLAHLVHGPGDVRAHGRGQGLCHILAVAAGVDPGAARHGQVLLRLHVYSGAGDIDGHRRTHGGLAAHGIAAGTGVGNGVLAGGQGQIALGGGHRAVQGSAHLVVQDIQRHGSVHGGLLHGVDVQFATQRIRTGNGSGGLRVIGLRVHRQAARGHAAVDLGGHAGIAVHHGEGRAHAHPAPLAVGGGGLAVIGVFFRRVHLHQDARHVLGRHGEGEHDLIAVFRGGKRHGVDLAVGGDIIDGIHLQARQLGLVDGDLDGIRHLGGQLAVLHGLVPALHGHGNCAIGHLALGSVVLAEVDGVQPGDGMQILLRGDHDGGQLAIRCGGIGSLHIIPGFPIHGLGIDLDLAGLFLTVVGIAPGSLISARGDLIAVPGRDPYDVLIGRILPELRAHGGFHLQLFAQMHRGRGGAAADGILFRLASRVLILVRVAVLIQGGAGDGGHPAGLPCVHGGFAGDGQRGAAADDGRGIGVQDGNGHTARDAHVLGARAGNSFGADDVLIGHILGRQLHVQIADQRFDGRVAHLCHGGVQRSAHHFLGLGREIGIGDLVHHGGIVEHLALKGIGQIVDKAVLLIIQRRGERRFDSVDILLRQHRHLAAQTGEGVVHQLAGQGGPFGFQGIQQRFLCLFLGGGLILALDLVVDGLHGQAANIILGAVQHGHHSVFEEVGKLRLQFAQQNVCEILRIHILQGGDLILQRIQRLEQLGGILLHGLPQITQIPQHLVHLFVKGAVAQQFIQAGFLKHVFHKGLREGGGQFADDGLVHAHFVQGVIDAVLDIIRQLGHHGVLAFGHFDGGHLIHFVIRLFGHQGGNRQAVGLHGAVADLGGILNIDDIHGHGRAYAGIGLGGAGVGLHLGFGAVDRLHLHRAADGDIRAVHDARQRLGEQHVHGHSRRAAHGALAGLRLLTVIGAGALHAQAAGEIAVGGNIARAAQDGIHLLVGAARAAVLARGALNAAGDTGGGIDTLGGVDAGGNGNGAVRGVVGHAVVQPRHSVIMDDGHAKRAAQGHTAAAGAGIGGHIVGSGVLGGDVGGFGIQIAAQNPAQVGGGGGAEHVHADHRGDAGFALRASLGGHLVGGLVGSGRLHLAAHNGDRRLILNGRGHIGAGHVHGDAGAHAGGTGFLRACRAAGGVQPMGALGGNRQGIGIDDRVLCDQGLCIKGSNLHAKAAGQAGHRLAVACGGGGPALAHGNSLHVHGLVVQRTAGEDRAVLRVYHGHRRRCAQAGFKRAGIGIALFKFALQGDVCLCLLQLRAGHGGRHGEGEGAVIPARQLHLIGRSAGGDLHRAAALLEAVTGLRGDGDHHLFALVRLGSGDLQRAVIQLRLAAVQGNGLFHGVYGDAHVGAVLDVLRQGDPAVLHRHLHGFALPFLGGIGDLRRVVQLLARLNGGIRQRDGNLFARADLGGGIDADILGLGILLQGQRFGVELRADADAGVIRQKRHGELGFAVLVRGQRNGFLYAVILVRVVNGDLPRAVVLLRRGLDGDHVGGLGAVLAEGQAAVRCVARLNIVFILGKPHVDGHVAALGDVPEVCGQHVPGTAGILMQGHLLFIAADIGIGSPQVILRAVHGVAVGLIRLDIEIIPGVFAFARRLYKVHIADLFIANVVGVLLLGQLEHVVADVHGVIHQIALGLRFSGGAGHGKAQHRLGALIDGIGGQIDGIGAVAVGGQRIGLPLAVLLIAQGGGDPRCHGAAVLLGRKGIAVGAVLLHVHRAARHVIQRQGNLFPRYDILTGEQLLLLLLLFLFLFFFLGVFHRAGAVGVGVHPGFLIGQDVHRFACGHAGAALDLGAVVVHRHGHGHRAVHLGLGLIHIVVGFCVLLFKRAGDLEGDTVIIFICQDALRHGEGIPAVAVVLQNGLLLLVFSLNIIGNNKAVVL